MQVVYRPFEKLITPSAFLCELGVLSLLISVNMDSE